MKKRILFFIPTLGGGGAEKVLVNLVNNLNPQKYDITVQTIFDYGVNKQFLEGLFFAPSVVASSLKTAVLTSKIMEELGYKTEPMYNEERADIVQNIEFGNPDDLIKYCQGIQMGSPVDSNSVAEPWDMPGYADKIIMAAGAFTQGSSIELSCDGPIRPPYIAFQQGGLTYQYGKLGVLKAVDNLLKNK